jgi:hypothetical protein
VFPSKAFVAAPSSPAVSWLSAYFRAQPVVEITVNGLTVSEAVLLVLLLVAVIVTAVELVTDVVVIVNNALVFPAVTVTEVGSEAAVELSLRVTVIPAEGAGPVKVTVP